MKRLGLVLLMMTVLAGFVVSAQQQGRGANPAAPAPQGRGANPAAPPQQGADPDIPTALQSLNMPWPPMHIYIRGGLKSHGPGLHDYPQFMADWSKLLTERGAIVDGGFHFPTTAELSGVNVIVMYKGDAGYMSADERATLEAYLKRGGGIVSFHDTLCGDDPQYLANILGGAKKHGERNFSAGEIAYTITDKNHPIMQGMSDFKINDEAFFLLTKPTLSPEGLHVLATAPMPKSNSAGEHVGEVVPQIWTYERPFGLGQSFRAFVWMQGHSYANFSDPQVQPMILRGIAWAAKWPIDALMTVRQPAQGGRGRGRGGA
jgi:type 1 glutamine amidotransferase